MPPDPPATGGGSADQPPEEAARNPFAADPSDQISANPYAAPQPASPVQKGAMGLPNRAGLVFALGLTGLLMTIFVLLCCGPLAFVGLFASVPAWVLGHQDLQNIDRGLMDPSARGLTMAGYVLGIVATVLILLVVLASAAMLVYAIFGL